MTVSASSISGVYCFLGYKRRSSPRELIRLVDLLDRTRLIRALLVDGCRQLGRYVRYQ